MKNILLTTLTLLVGLTSFSQVNGTEGLEHKVYNSIGEALKTPDDVKILNLFDKKLEEFPMEVLKFSNLISLKLTKN